MTRYHAVLKQEQGRWPRLVFACSWSRPASVPLPILWARRLYCWLRRRPYLVDMDVVALLFDAQKALLAVVDDEQSYDASGALYHSGDNPDGLGEGEHIALEPGKLAAEIAYIAFCVRLPIGQNLSHAAGARIAMVDMARNIPLHETYPQQGGDCLLAYYLCRVNEQWEIHEVGGYAQQTEIVDLPSWVMEQLP